MLSLEEISLQIGHSETGQKLLDAVSLSLSRGRLVGLVGPSGCGKSTLLKVIAGLAEPTEGVVRWEGRDLATEGDLPPAELGYVPQFSIAHELLTVSECVTYAARLRVAGQGAEARQERVAELLQTTGLAALADRPVRVLSGGQRRRLSLAIEMVTSPSLLLCDEVTSGLDPGSAREILVLLHELSRSDGGSRRVVINVTHSLADLHLYDWIVVLCGGMVAFNGKPEYLNHYFSVPAAEEIFERLENRPAQDWRRSWSKHGVHYGAEAAVPTEVQTPGGEANSKALAEGAPEERGSRISATGASISAPSAVRPSAEDGETSSEAEEDLNVGYVPQSWKTEKTAEQTGPPPPETPGAATQLIVILERRLRLFFRDRAQLALQVALAAGFPCLVVIFALKGLPQIRNLSLENNLSVLEQIQESTAYLLQAVDVGGLVSGLILFQIILLALMGSNNSAQEVAGERQLLESEKLAGLSPASFIGAKCIFLAMLVTVQSVWMALFVHWVCAFPGDIFGQIALLWLADGALTAVCLAFSSLARTPQQASLISIYFVGFQLPLSGAVLALPDAMAKVTRPFIAAYWSWSGVIQTMRETRFYDLVLAMTKTELAAVGTCYWVLLAHIGLGVLIAYLGCQRSSWQ